MTMRNNQNIILFILTTTEILLLSCLAVAAWTSAKANISTALVHPTVRGRPPARQSQLHLLPVRGTASPQDFFLVTIPVGFGQSRKDYDLDPDTGSDLTWMPCSLPFHPIPSVPPGFKVYEARLEQIVQSTDPVCASLGDYRAEKCEFPWECCYKMQYLDGSSSRGVLVRDILTLGHLVDAPVVIGCGYDQPPSTVTLQSILGLGRGPLGIPSQLHHQYGIGNVTGHCLSTKKDNRSFIFFGRHHKFFNLRCLTWTDKSLDVEHYSPGKAELFYDRTNIGPNGLHVIFDTGSTYTYLTSSAFHNILLLVTQGLPREFVSATEPNHRPHCWKLNSQQQVPDIVAYAKMHLKSISFGFPDGKYYTIPPESYFFQSNLGNLCLALRDGGSDNFNIIGDFSLQGKILIFDNEEHKIGWGTVSCDWLRPVTPAVCA